MKWKMEIEEIEAILEKLWDLHDKLSDAIHSISRTHFLSSVKALRNSHNAEDRGGFVFVKDLPLDDDESAVHEAKSLYAIRTALENLEDQLEFFHNIQTQQRVERDAAIARLEQSREVLAMRLAEHHGKKYKVIEEAQAFVGVVHDVGRHEILCCENFGTEKGKRSNILIKVFVSSFKFVKKSLGFDHVGNAALVALSMIALLHLHQVMYNEHPFSGHEDGVNGKTSVRNKRLKGSLSNSHSSDLDVLLARG